MNNILRRGSSDWNEIVRRFRAKEYDRRSYSAGQILKQNPDWAAKYQPTSFAQSVRNLVSELYLQAPPKPTKRSAGQEDDTVEEDDTVPNRTHFVPPNYPDMQPSGQSMLSPDNIWQTPSHQVEWVDSSPNQNQRLTLYNQLLPGDVNENYTFRVERNGSQLVETYEWPEEFLDPGLLIGNHGFYHAGHAKIVAFKEACRELKGGRSDQPVRSVWKRQLLFPCEQQLATSEVPNGKGVYSGVFNDLEDTSNKVKLVGIELMGVRTNYETDKVEEEYEIHSPAPKKTAPAPATARAQSTHGAHAGGVGAPPTASHAGGGGFAARSNPQAQPQGAATAGAGATAVPPAAAPPAPTAADLNAQQERARQADLAKQQAEAEQKRLHRVAVAQQRKAKQLEAEATRLRSERAGEQDELKARQAEADRLAREAREEANQARTAKEQAEAMAQQARQHSDQLHQQQQNFQQEQINFQEQYLQEQERLQAEQKAVQEDKRRLQEEAHREQERLQAQQRALDEEKNRVQVQINAERERMRAQADQLRAREEALERQQNDQQRQLGRQLQQQYDSGHVVSETQTTTVQQQRVRVTSLAQAAQAAQQRQLLQGDELEASTSSVVSEEDRKIRADARQWLAVAHTYSANNSVDNDETMDDASLSQDGGVTINDDAGGSLETSLGEDGIDFVNDDGFDDDSMVDEFELDSNLGDDLTSDIVPV